MMFCVTKSWYRVGFTRLLVLFAAVRNLEDGIAGTGNFVQLCESVSLRRSSSLVLCDVPKASAFAKVLYSSI